MVNSLEALMCLYLVGVMAERVGHLIHLGLFPAVLCIICAMFIHFSNSREPKGWIYVDRISHRRFGRYINLLYVLSGVHLNIYKNY